MFLDRFIRECNRDCISIVEPGDELLAAGARVFHQDKIRKHHPEMADAVLKAISREIRRNYERELIRAKKPVRRAPATPKPRARANPTIA